MTILSHALLIAICQNLTTSVLHAISAHFKKQKYCVRSVYTGFRYNIISIAVTSHCTNNYCNKDYIALYTPKKYRYNLQFPYLGVFL